ncbi:hypothetical protein BD779DRAFT_1445663, partial [Infundibulicybe gibba]
MEHTPLVHRSRDGRIFTSLNSTILPPVPREGMKRSHQIHPSRLFAPRWLEDMAPQGALIPKYPHFDGPLFGRLDVSGESLPIVYQSQTRTYHLDTEVQESWGRLEFALYDLSTILHKALQLSIPYCRRLAFPSHYGYTHNHTSAEIAKQCVMNSRDAFVPLMAACSMVMVLFEARGNLSVDNPSWASYLISKGVYPAWI